MDRMQRLTHVVSDGSFDELDVQLDLGQSQPVSVN